MATEPIECVAIDTGYYEGRLINEFETVLYKGNLKPDENGNLTVLPLWLMRKDLPIEEAQEEKRRKRLAAETVGRLNYNNIDTPPSQNKAVQSTQPPVQPENSGMTQDLPATPSADTPQLEKSEQDIFGDS